MDFSDVARFASALQRRQPPNRLRSSIPSTVVESFASKCSLRNAVDFGSRSNAISSGASGQSRVVRDAMLFTKGHGRSVVGGGMDDEGMRS